MDAYSGKYYIHGGDEHEATVVILKDKLSIGIKDEHGNPRVVLWPFDQIIRDNFWKRGQTVVRCGSYPVQTIEVNEKELADKLENIFTERERSWISRTLNRNFWGMARVLLVFFAVIIAAYIWLVPYLADRLARKVPISFEEKVGGEMYEAIKSSFIIDPTKTAYINEFFRELKIDSKYNIQITVVKDTVTNAFAVPGGNIVVYDKILAGMNGHADLAALLAHEFIHINERHTTRALFRQKASSLFLVIILGDVGSLGNALINSADNLKTLSYSRSLEKEADMTALKILSERKIDCNGFIGLFQQLQKEVQKASRQPSEWISSHPDLEKRMNYIKTNEWFNKNGVEENEALKTLFLKIQTTN